MDCIGIEHSGKFEGKFRVVALNKKYDPSRYTANLWQVILRDDLTQTQARRLAEHIRQAINVKLTEESCGYCGGIGGCYMCDS